MKSTMKSAVLAIALAATASMNAATLEGNVPMEFQVGKQIRPAGPYKITPQRAGIVVMKTADGAAVGIKILPVQTETERTAKNSLTFARNANGSFELAGYCVAGNGCWSARNAKSGAAAGKIEVAMLTAK